MTNALERIKMEVKERAFRNHEGPGSGSNFKKTSGKAWEDLIREGDKGANHADIWRKSESDISVPDVCEK